MCAHLYCVYKPSGSYFSCNGANEKSRLKNKIMSLIHYTPGPAKRSREVFSVYFFYYYLFILSPFFSLHYTIRAAAIFGSAKRQWHKKVGIIIIKKNCSRKSSALCGATDTRLGFAFMSRKRAHTKFPPGKITNAFRLAIQYNTYVYNIVNCDFYLKFLLFRFRV